ncbi:hypothetical protein [Phaeacidiphilus oryzae]|uniref:hypothetical protein n=1 Tax=Phaeacidiphilus oryzae TaxID=348818 RepID=UPI00056B8B7C|nr:hypothetical protein [Phaeacidiphilus oryzae]
MAQLPFYVWLLTIAGAALFIASTALALRRAPIVAWSVVALSAAWFAGDWLLADAHAYQAIGSSNLSIGLIAAFAGYLTILLAATGLPVVRRALASPDAVARLTRPQSVRVMGVVLLIALAIGRLPAAFALPAGIGDIAVGLAAPLAVRALRHAPATDRLHRRAVTFHLLGLADLVIALVMGVVSGLLVLSPTMQPITAMPLVLVPTLAVPTAFALHLTALRRLRADRAASRPARTTAPTHQPGPAPVPEPAPAPDGALG